MRVAHGPKTPVLVPDGELKCNNQINIGLQAIVRNITYLVPGVNAEKRETMTISGTAVDHGILWP